MPQVTDPQKMVTDPVLLSALIKQGIDKDYVEFYQDYASRSLGKEHSPYAKFYRDLNSNKRFMVVSGLPMVDADGIKIECGWRVAGVNYFSEKNNLFRARVQGIDVELIVRNDQPDGRKANDRLAYKPQLFLNGVEQLPTTPILLPVDPVNPNYLENTLEWDYSICKRRLRIIGGRILGSWVFPANPYGEVRIKYNQIGDYRLKLERFSTDNDTEIVPAPAFITDEFGKPRQYPFTVQDTATYYPDTNAAGVDGQVRRHVGPSSEIWATLRSGAGTTAFTGLIEDSFIQTQGYNGYANYWHRIYRDIFIIDTSGLPDDAAISGATLSLYGTAKSDTLSAAPVVNVYSSNPASNTALVAADYNIALWGSTAFATGITYANWLITGYNDFVFNADGLAAISKVGVSKFGTRSTYDATNVAPPNPTGDQSFYLYGYYTAQGAGFKPKLVVTYTVPATTQGQASLNAIKLMRAGAL